MKALIYRKFGSADELEWTDGWPKPEFSSRTVLVRTLAGSINPKDALLRKGKFSRTFARDPLPRVSGLDVSGEIVAVGSEVRNYAIGDMVFGMTNHFAGGIHAEFAMLHQREIYYLPSNISIAEASSVPLAAQTALQALRDCCEIEKGHKVLINGASGGVGHFAVQIAKVLGAEVHAVCGPGNVPFVKSLGADTVYDYSDQAATKIELTFDAVFDVFGKLGRSAFKKQLTNRGTYVSTVPKPATLWGEALARIGVCKGARLVMVRSQSENLKLIKEWIESGFIVPKIEKIYPVEGAADAHRHIESKHTIGKVCIMLSSDCH